MSTRNQWTSRLGFILAAAGSAIGLGAIWKFPYVTAMNGGGAFLLLFLGFSFTLGLAMMMAEISIGRAAKNGAVGAFAKLGSKPWALLGLMGVLTSFIILCFYSVVGGWTVAYLGKALDGSVLSSDPKLLEQQFGDFVSNPTQAIAAHVAFALATVLIVVGGIEKGIERANKLLMPALFLIMLLLIARSLTLPGAWDGVVRFLSPDFSKVGMSTVLEALGLAFFSLSLGIGVMVAYGSYLKPQDHIAGASMWVVGLASLVAILAGLIIFPAMAAFGLNPAAGPGLTFMTMPVIFDHLPLGQVFAVAFFALLLLAALSSAISALEVVAIWFIDDLKLPRRPVVAVLGLLVMLGGVPAALSFGPWADVKFFGKSIFDLLDYTASNVLMPLGAIGVAVFAGWIAAQRAASESGLSGRWLSAWQLTCRYLAPALIAVVMVRSL